MNQTKQKTLLVGFDAANWEYLNPLLEAGELPNLEKLMGRGAWGTLYSTMPALTPVAWSSIATGKNPGKHGIFDMTYRRPDRYEFLPVNAKMRVGTPFWTRLNEAGLKVGLVNVPFTYPPDEVDGFVICGFGTPESAPDLIYPPQAKDLIVSKFGQYTPVVSAEMLMSQQPDLILQAERELQDKHIRMGLMLADQYRVDVLVINLMLLDHLNHKMPEMPEVNEAIRQLDRDLKLLMDGFEPDNVMVISDHGSRRVQGDFFLHAWLRDEGYAVQKKRPSADTDNALNWTLIQWLQEQQGWSGTPEKVTRRLLRSVVPHLPASLNDKFWHKVAETVPFAREQAVFSEVVDGSVSRLLLGGSYSSILYFNKAGREPQGVVTEAGETALRDELIQKLMQLKDPATGELLFEAVFSPQDLYMGDMMPFAPDLIIDSYNSDWNIMSSFKRGVTAERAEHKYFIENSTDFGHHSRDGIFVYAGAPFKAGQVDEEAKVLDIPATLLHVHGVAIPEDWDGRSQQTSLTAEFLAENPVQQQAGDSVTFIARDAFYSDEETDEIFAHLRALGYVD